MLVEEHHRSKLISDRYMYAMVSGHSNNDTKSTTTSISILSLLPGSSIMLSLANAVPTYLAAVRLVYLCATQMTVATRLVVLCPLHSAHSMPFILKPNSMSTARRPGNAQLRTPGPSSAPSSPWCPSSAHRPCTQCPCPQPQ